MTTPERTQQDTKAKSRFPISDKAQGFFNSATLALSPEVVFRACQNPENVKRVLSDLPKGLENFLDLTLVSAQKKTIDEFEIQWKNQATATVQGTLSFSLKKAPANRGTILSAVATFEKLKSHDEEPSDLMNVFLKRMKALIETGEIPTTKGQPSGRDEIKNTLH